jgi:rfaE bifunctional protein kinase chain/domain
MLYCKGKTCRYCVVKLASAFKHLNPFKALVIGDIFVDTYTIGRIKRISPEAPVPVLEVLKQESRPGGAGNVILNLLALGAHVFVAGRVGEDAHGQELKQRLISEGADVSALLTESDYTTPVKNRLIADSQQLIRVDFEKVTPLPFSLEEKLIDKLCQIIPETQIIAISDYGKGFLTNSLIAKIIKIARKKNVPVIIDPKGSDFRKYKNATVLKPNLSEAYAAANMPLSASLDEVAKVLLNISDVEVLLITRSEAGMSLFAKNKIRQDFPVQAKEVKDVTGAGDTALAFICLALANNLDIYQAAQLANIAACISIERLGCIQVTLSELAHRLLETHSDMKIFEENHVYALHHVLKNKHYSLLVLQNGQSITHALVLAVKELSNRENRQLILYVNDPHPNEEFIHLLSSLSAVNMIILQSESLKNLCRTIHPHEIYFLEGEKLSQLDEAKDLLTTLLNYSSI